MDKKNILATLKQTFLKESDSPAIALSAKIGKEDDKINKAGVKEMDKNIKAYDKNLKQKADGESKMAPNKYNYTDKFQDEYHNEMEIMNGQEMLQYASKPDDRFSERTKEGIEGSSKMGNENKVGNAEASWNASSNDFGKNYTKRVKSSINKRDSQTPTIALKGQNIQAPEKDLGHKPYAIDENNKKTIKETMKRLNFKEKFNGFGNALKLIPESYKVNNKTFEMSDGNENYRIRWEGTSNGTAVILSASDNKLINEDLQRMKALFGYKSEDTLGLLKGKSRIDENKMFDNIWKKSKQLLGESCEDIEGQSAKTGDLDDAVKSAPEAKKHIEGTTSTDKGTVAPKPKSGNWEDNVKGQAPEAKKHVEGSVSTDKGTVAPKPKQGYWDDKVKGQAPEAITEDEEMDDEEEILDEIWMKEEIEDDDSGEEEPEAEDEEGDEEEPEDDYVPSDKNADKVTKRDTYDFQEKAPSKEDVKGIEVPEPVAIPTNQVGSGAKLMKSDSTKQYFIVIGGKPQAIPMEFQGMAADLSLGNPSQRADIIIQKMKGR